MQIQAAIDALRKKPDLQRTPSGVYPRLFGAIKQVFGNEYFNKIARYHRSHPSSSKDHVAKKFKVSAPALHFIFEVAKNAKSLKMIEGVEGKPPVRQRLAIKNKMKTKVKMVRDKHKLLWKKANYNVLGLIDLDKYPSLIGKAMQDAQRLLVDSFNKAGMDKVEVIHLANGQAEFRRING